MSKELSRRNFVAQAAALAAAPAALPALAASDRVTLGVVGNGGRGYYLTQRAFAGNRGRFQIGAICDTYSTNLNREKDYVQTEGKNTPRTFVDYKDLLADKSIDAVIIATPEHLHHRMLLDALAAGKHVYVEKPLAHTVEEAQEIMKVVAKSKSVIQVGTQNRSNSLYQMARTMVNQGLIGDCHYVRAFWYRNALPTGAAAWRYPVPADASETTADWKRFLGPAQMRDFNKNRYFQWRLYWDYSNGIATDLMVHQTDVIAYVLGYGIPGEVMANGNIYRWTENDDREVPDTLTCLLDYPKEKLQINYSCYLGNVHYGYGEQFMGNEGTIEVVNRSTLSYWPETYQGAPKEWATRRKEMTLTIPFNDDLAVEAHLRNLIHSIQGTEKLIAPVQAGYEAAITGLLSTVSVKSGRKVKWDNAADKYTLA
jgi:predicted dehydrogenase